MLSPRSTSEFAWTTFRDPGWDNAGLSALIGLQASVVPLLGADASVHMSEELKDAAYTLPRSMMWATTINGAMGFVTAITVAYCIGDLETGTLCGFQPFSLYRAHDFIRSAQNEDRIPVHSDVLQFDPISRGNECHGVGKFQD